MDTMLMLENLSCPIDSEPLNRDTISLKCKHGHTFDLAKTGYVNLLPVQHKRSKDPGDNKTMVRARQNFLNQEHYYPIVEAILSSYPREALSSLPRILDAGCGEGYYLDKLGELFQQHNIANERVGLDISKWAITAASKRDNSASWIVGSNACLPMPNERFDAVFCLFGFPVFEEFYRVLSTNGIMLLVESGAEHLIELRRILYPSVHEYKPTYTSGIEGFELIHETVENYGFHLSSQQAIQNLLMMTPHIHKASFEGREAVKELVSIDLTADVKLRWYRKT